MKKRYIRTLFSGMILVSGCISKSFLFLKFDEFSMKFYDNTVKYTEMQPESTSPGVKILKEYKEIASKEFTGFINSLLVIKIPIQTGIDIQKLAENNIKNLTLKLLKYKSIYSELKKAKCNDRQYSGYIFTFSYQLDNETIYGGQYYFAYDDALYLISLHSEINNDITSFIKSIKTVKCVD